MLKLKTSIDHLIQKFCSIPTCFLFQSCLINVSLYLGGGGHHGTLPKAQSSVNIQALAGIIKGKSLMEMATKGEDGVTIDGAIKLVKFAFCFEQWEVFEVLNDAVLHYLRVGFLNSY